MRSLVCLIGLMLSVQANTAQQATVPGQVRLADGRPVAGAQVTLFDLADLHQGAVARAMTDESGHFALPLASLGGSALPQGFALGQNYPNPFNPATVIPYQLPTAAHVRLDVFNVLGQHVATLVDAEKQAGFHAAKWDATDAAGQAMAAGVYLYRLTAGGGQQTQRMVLVDGQAGIAAEASATEVTRFTDAAEREYGLVVSGEGLTTYMDAAFEVRVGMAAVELVVDAAPLTKGQVLAGEILGDVNNDGQVVVEDAMLIAMYNSNLPIAMPNNGSILLGDVNGDGQVNETDVLVIMRYISNPLDGALPAGIGQRIASGKRVSDDSGVIRLTDDSRRDAQPSWSPDGGQIAFSSYGDGNWDIYVMAADGSNPTRLTDDSRQDVQPSWSPDGGRIVFSSNRRDGNWDIYVMAADGSNPTRLTDDSRRDEYPSWSPDGGRIAFSSTRRDGNYDIYVMAADGSNPTRLTDDSRRDEYPSWSPDGGRIAFSSTRRDGNYDIYVMAADGSNPTRLTDDSRRDEYPSWSPDGGRIAFSSTRRDGNYDIYVMAADGSNPTRLTDDSRRDVQPSWSPDGGRIAFSSTRRDGNWDIYVMEVDGAETLGPVEEPIVDREPTFSGTVADQTVTEGAAMSSLVLPVGLGGDGELSYSLSPEVPGLTFDAATRTLSGTPTVAGDYALTYRVEDSDGDVAELRFTVTVEGKPIVDREPTFSGTVADQTVTEGAAMSSLVLPVGLGGDGELSYSLSPEVPGLTFDAATRTLSGTPTVAEDYALTYRVEDSDGDAAELTFVLRVDGLPGFEGMAELPGGESMEFVWIEPGAFQMGSNTGRKDESPVHEVEISRGFWLGKYEITQGQWKSVMDTEPWAGRDRVEANPSHPAVIISWDEVQEFISRLNAEAGEELYRLPTEAEWEYACRAETQTRWSFGDDESQLTNYAWYHGNNYPTKGAKEVGRKDPNPWGLYDMHGNVWEWVQDWYDEEYYSRSVRNDPQGPISGLGRVIRGGHFGHIDGVRSAYRHFHAPDSRSYTIGVRLLRIAGD